MWKSDMKDEGEHGYGKPGALRGTSLSGDGELYLERSRKPWVEKYHWTTGKKPAAVYEIDELRNLHLCCGALDVPRKRTRQAKWKLNKIEAGICPAPLLMAEELNSIPRADLLKPLVQESAGLLKDQAISRRGHLNGNCIQAWQETSERILAVHTVGGIGHKMALSRVEAGCDDEGLPDWGDVHMETIDTVECGLSEILQVAVSTAEMGEEVLSEGRIIAARSRQSVSILSMASTDGDWKLWMHGQTTPHKADVSDVRFNPYAYPESLLGLDDGSVRVVDLDRLGNMEGGLHIHDLGSEVVCEFGAPLGKKCRTVCEYGLTPRQIYCGVGSQIKYVDLRAGMQLHDIAGFKLNETVTGLCNGLSSSASMCECPHLMAATTTKRALVYDLRCVSSPLLSWKLPNVIGFPSHVDFLLSPMLRTGESDQDGVLEGVGRDKPGGFESGGDFDERGAEGSGLLFTNPESIGNTRNGQSQRQSFSEDGDSEDDDRVGRVGTQFSQFVQKQSQPEPENDGCREGRSEQLLQGTVVVGSMVSGEFVQCPFMVGNGKIVLIPEAGGDSRGRKRKALVGGPEKVVKIRRVGDYDEGLPVRHEQTLRTLDIPSFLCRSLKSVKGLDVISCLDMRRLIARLDHKYRTKEGVTHRVLDLEAAEWKGFIQHSADVLGMCFIPFNGTRDEGRVDGVVIRQNSVGDLVLDTCNRRDDELGKELNPLSTCGEQTEESEGEAGGCCFARKRISQEQEEAEFGIHDEIEMVETEVGRVREVNVANSDVRSSVWWDGYLHVRCIPWRQRKEILEEKLRGSLPRYLSWRRGRTCDRNYQTVLNFFNAYAELRSKMIKRFEEEGEVFVGWDLEKEAVAELSEAPGGLSVWELQQKRALAFYKKLEGVGNTKARGTGECGVSTEAQPGGSSELQNASENRGSSDGAGEIRSSRRRNTLPWFLVDVLGRRNLGGVHLCHEELIRKELTSEVEKSKKSKKRVTRWWSRFMASSDTLLHGRKKSKDLLKWMNESESWAGGFNEVYALGGERNIEFERSKYVQPWGDDTFADLSEARDKWKEGWADLAMS